MGTLGGRHRFPSILFCPRLAAWLCMFYVGIEGAQGEMKLVVQ